MPEYRRVGPSERLEDLDIGEIVLFPAPWGELVKCARGNVENGTVQLEVIGTYAPGNPFYEKVSEYVDASAGAMEREYDKRDGKIVWRVCVAEHKPCPFCNEEYSIEPKRFDDFDVSDDRVTRTGYHWAVICPWCGTKGPSASDEKEAWGLWDVGLHGEREDYAEAYRRVGNEVYVERMEREGWFDD